MLIPTAVLRNGYPKIITKRKKSNQLSLTIIVISFHYYKSPLYLCFSYIDVAITSQSQRCVLPCHAIVGHVIKKNGAHTRSGYNCFLTLLV